MLQHAHQLVDHNLLVQIARDDLPPLKQVCMTELAGTEQPPPPRA